MGTAFRVIHFVLLLLAASATLALGWRTDLRWLAAAVAVLLYTKAARSAFLVARREAFRRNAVLIWSNVECIQAAGWSATSCLFAISFIAGEGWWGAVGAGFAAGISVVHLYIARRSRASTQVT